MATVKVNDNILQEGAFNKVYFMHKYYLTLKENYTELDNSDFYMWGQEFVLVVEHKITNQKFRITKWHSSNLIHVSKLT